MPYVRKHQTQRRGSHPAFLLAALILTCLLASSGTAAAQTTPTKTSPTQTSPAQTSPQTQPVQTYSPADPLPVDPGITIGKLDSGLTYYIQVNHKPEQRAYVALAVNVGSVLEDDDQQGLAHFVEHMSFNGTAKFAKHQLLDYLESIGTRFGPEINAYTGFDETVYHLEIPTDSTGVLDRGIEILSEWAHAIAFEDEEIDKERGVVIEEWRQGRGAAARMFDKELPVLLKGSKYAERLPIGKVEIIETFDHDALRRFYRDWYRPELMGVIAVGDFDAAETEALIRQHFSAIPAGIPPGAAGASAQAAQAAQEAPRPRPSFPVPDHDETLFAIVTDKEATETWVGLNHRLPAELTRTVADQRRKLIEQLYDRMLNARLAEMLEQPDPPFVTPYSWRSRFARTKDFYMLGADVKEDGVLRGLEAVLLEARRAQVFGFAQSELDRQTDQMLRNLEVAYNERDKTESGRLAGRCISHFLNQDPLPGIENEFRLAQQLVPGITLEEVNHLDSRRGSGSNNVIVVEAPEKEGLAVPDEAALRALMAAVLDKEVTPYEDKVSGEPLVANPPAGSPVISEGTLPDVGVTEWTLGNGARVILKPTDFKNDEVLFWAQSPGGTSLAPDQDFVPAWFASTLVGISGVGSFDAVGLKKRLMGKVVSVGPYMEELGEGLRGSAAPEDLEALFQLVYDYFTASRLDSISYLSYKTRMEAGLKNRDADPGNAFSDTLMVTLSQHHPRRPVLTAEVLERIDPETSHAFYRERFADASDFTFFFVGAFEPDSIRPMVETYLGGLPALHRSETWKDLGIDPPSGVITREIRKGIEPKSRASLVFAGPFEWSLDSSHGLGALASALRIKLREVIREDEGGTYNVSVGASSSKYPDQEYSVSIGFGCDPERVDELVSTVFDVIDSVRTVPLDETYIEKVKEAERREWEVNLKQNAFWLRNLRYYYFYDVPRDEMLRYPERVEALSAETVRKIAERYLSRDTFIEVVLYPEGFPENN
jgi:zinc protease